MKSSKENNKALLAVKKKCCFTLLSLKLIPNDYKIEKKNKLLHALEVFRPATDFLSLCKSSLFCALAATYRMGINSTSLLHRLF